MDDLLKTLLSFPPAQPLSEQQYDEGIKVHIENLKRITTRQLLQFTHSGEHLLSVIDPCRYTLAYIQVLSANIAALQTETLNQSSLRNLWSKLLGFLTCFDAKQVRYVGAEFSRIVSAVASLSRKIGEPGLVVAPICEAIRRLDPVGSTLTSMHLLLVQLSLESRAYTHALPVLDRPILYIAGVHSNPKARYICSSSLSGPQYLSQDSGLTQKLKYQDILEYFVLGGTIYTGMRMWDRALEMFQIAITYPVKENAVSKIMVEGYKKWTLVNILVRGKSGVLPLTTNNNASKLYYILGNPYDIVANLFDSASAARLKAEVDLGQDIWEKDGNLGLMQCVLTAYQEFQIRNLASVYHTIPIGRITKITISAETGEHLANDQAMEELVNKMLSRKELHAKLVTEADASHILVFNLTGPILSESDVRRQLSSSVEQAKSTMTNIKATDNKLIHDREYLKWVVKQRKYGSTTPGDGYSAEELGWNVGADEDLMGN